MKFEQAQSLGKDEARRRIEALTDYWHNHYGVAVTWTGESAHLKGSVKGLNFDANLVVRDASVDAQGSDPGLLLKVATTTYLKRKLGLYLDPAKTLQDLAQAET